MKINTDSIMESLDTITENTAFRYLLNSLYSEVEPEELGWESVWECEKVTLSHVPTKGIHTFYVHTGTLQCRFSECDVEPKKLLESKVYTNVEYGLKELCLKYAVLGTYVKVHNRTVYVYA
jgi:hypothetical protein